MFERSRMQSILPGPSPEQQLINISEQQLKVLEKRNEDLENQVGILERQAEALERQAETLERQNEILKLQAESAEKVSKGASIRSWFAIGISIASVLATIASALIATGQLRLPI